MFKRFGFILATLFFLVFGSAEVFVRAGEPPHPAPPAIGQTLPTWVSPHTAHREVSLSPAAPQQSTAHSPNLALLGQIGGAADGIAVQGNYAYMGEGAWLDVLDLTSPAAPSLVGRSPLLAGIIQDIFISGNYAYAATFAGLYSIDISNPTQSLVIGYYPTTDASFGVDIAGALAYLVHGHALDIVDISNPANLSHVGHIATPGWARGVMVSGTVAYVANGASGLRVIDVSTPSSPATIGIYDTGYTMNVFVSGNYAYLAQFDSGLTILDISYPSGPSEVCNYDVSTDMIFDVVVIGGVAYLSGLTDSWPQNGEFITLNVSTPSNPQELGRRLTVSAAENLSVSGSNAFVTDRDAGLFIFGVSDPAHPSSVGTYGIVGSSMDTHVSGNVAYMAAYAAGLWSIDVTDPSHPVTLDRYPSTPVPEIIGSDVFYSSGVAYLASNLGGLILLDASNPASLTELGVYSPQPDGEALEVWVQGNTAYTFAWENLDIVDVSDSAHPSRIGRHNLNDYGEDIQVMNGIAYIASDFAFRILDVNNPASVSQIWQYMLDSGYCTSVFVDGSTAYLTTYDTGLLIFNVSNPVSPVLLGHYAPSSKIWDVFVKDLTAYMVDDEGLTLLDISNPAQPQQIGYYDLPNRAKSVVVEGNRIYVSAEYAGLFILTTLDESIYLPLLQR